MLVLCQASLPFPTQIHIPGAKYNLQKKGKQIEIKEQKLTTREKNRHSYYAKSTPLLSPIHVSRAKYKLPKKENQLIKWKNRKPQERK